MFYSHFSAKSPSINIPLSTQKREFWFYLRFIKKIKYSKNRFIGSNCLEFECAHYQVSTVLDLKAIGCKYLPWSTDEYCNITIEHQNRRKRLWINGGCFKSFWVVLLLLFAFTFAWEIFSTFIEKNPWV